MTGVPAMRAEDYFAQAEPPVQYVQARPQAVFQPMAAGDNSAIFITLGIVGVALLAVLVGSNMSGGGNGRGCHCRRR